MSIITADMMEEDFEVGFFYFSVRTHPAGDGNWLRYSHAALKRSPVVYGPNGEAQERFLVYCLGEISSEVFIHSLIGHYHCKRHQDTSLVWYLL